MTRILDLLGRFTEWWFRRATRFFPYSVRDLAGFLVWFLDGLFTVVAFFSFWGFVSAFWGSVVIKGPIEVDGVIHPIALLGMGSLGGILVCLAWGGPRYFLGWCRSRWWRKLEQAEKARQEEAYRETIRRLGRPDPFWPLRREHYYRSGLSPRGPRPTGAARAGGEGVWG